MTTLTSLWSTYYNISVSASIWMVCIVIVRSILCKAHVPRTICRIFWLVLCGLLCTSWRIPLPTMHITADANNSVPTVLAQSLATFASNNALAPATTPTIVSWRMLFAIIWFAGVLHLLLHSVFAYQKLRAHVFSAYRVDTTFGTYYTGTGVDIPFVLGFFRPKIYLPSTLSESEVRFIFLHERTHIKHGDFLLKPIFHLLLCLHWFNPLVWVCFRLMIDDLETACDETVLQTLGNDIKPCYCASLLNFAQCKFSPTLQLSFGANPLKKRVQQILKYHKPTFFVMLFGTALVCCCCIIFLCKPNVVHTVTDRTLLATSIPSNSIADTSSIPQDTNTTVMELLWPIPDSSEISFGMTEDHHGVDVVAEKGAPIVAMADGIVMDTSIVHFSLGKVAMVDHGSGITSLYAHCDTVTVKPGQAVTAGEVIGTVGTTGNSTGSHCHIEFSMNQEFISIEDLFANKDSDTINFAF